MDALRTTRPVAKRGRGPRGGLGHAARGALRAHRAQPPSPAVDQGDPRQPEGSLFPVVARAGAALQRRCGHHRPHHPGPRLRALRRLRGRSARALRQADHALHGAKAASQEKRSVGGHVENGLDRDSENLSVLKSTLDTESRRRAGDADPPLAADPRRRRRSGGVAGVVPGLRPDAARIRMPRRRSAAPATCSTRSMS